MKKVVFGLLGLAWLFNPTQTYAHSFGKLYSLPVPLWLYLFGAAATIAISFLIIGYFFNKTESNPNYPNWKLPQNKLTVVLTKNYFQNILKFLSLFLFALTIATGLLGNQIANQNFNMTFFWIIFVLGFTYLTAIFGDFYSFFNPLRIVVEIYEKLTKTKLKGIMRYPKVLAYYPALILYFLFIWVELFGKTAPFSLSVILLIYSCLSLTGIILFGKDIWLKYGEFFSVFFQLLGKIAPVEVRDGRLYLRPPFVGLLKTQSESFSLLLFIMFMLSSTAFDGFHSTVLSYDIYYPNVHTFLRPLFGDFSFQIYQYGSLIISPFIFLSAYLIFLKLAKIITKSSLSLFQLSLAFAFSLIPIVLAYNLAHYYTLILTEGQNIFYLLSDPFGFKWNLFGTANLKPNLSVINATSTWNFQIAFILLGHIVGVYLAHLIALKIFPSHKKALFSQLPLLLLMILYTLTGLLILSLPINVFG